MLKHEKIKLVNHTHGPVGELAYLRPNQVPRKYPFSRALVYELLASGDVKSICLRKPGNVRGIRLIPVSSIETYLAKIAGEQERVNLPPVVAKKDAEKGADAALRRKIVTGTRRKDVEKAGVQKNDCR